MFNSPFFGYTWSSMKAESLKQPKSSQTRVSPNNWHMSSHFDISQYVQFKKACLICCFFDSWLMGSLDATDDQFVSVRWISRYVMAHGVTLLTGSSWFITVSALLQLLSVHSGWRSGHVSEEPKAHKNRSTKSKFNWYFLASLVALTIDKPLLTYRSFQFPRKHRTPHTFLL